MIWWIITPTQVASPELGRATSSRWVNYPPDWRCFYGVCTLAMGTTRMSIDAQNLPDDPAVLKAMIAALQAENAQISATLRVHDQLVQASR